MSLAGSLTSGPMLLPLHHIPLHPVTHPGRVTHPRRVIHPCSCRLQELEDQYRREREEATYLLEQQRLVRVALSGPQAPHDAWVGWGEPGPCCAKSSTLPCPKPLLC